MLIGGDYIWTDESYTFALIRHSFSEIWKLTAADSHPPLYYWYLKILTAPFHYSMAAAKLASILPYMFIIVFGGKQLRKYVNERTALLFMVMFFCFPFALPYSIEIRMYSLSAALVFACGVFAYRFWQKQGQKNDMAGFILSGVLAAYTHYFAFVSICVIYGLLFLAILSNKSGLWKKWLLSVFISVILYSPWLSSFLGQLVYKVNHEYWIEEITVHTLFLYWKKLFGVRGFGVYALFFSAAYLVCFLLVLAGKNKKDIFLCLCCILVPVGTLAVGVLASVIVRPVFVIRYLVPAIPLLVTFMAIVLGKTKHGGLLCCMLAVVLLGGISGYGVTIQSEYWDHNYLPIEGYGDVDAFIVVGDTHIAGTLGYYVTEKTIYSEKDLYASNPYPNLVPIDDFASDHADKAIMLLHVGETPPVEYFDTYQIEPLGQWRCEYNTDAFLLTKKMG